MYCALSLKNEILFEFLKMRNDTLLPQILHQIGNSMLDFLLTLKEELFKDLKVNNRCNPNLIGLIHYVHYIKSKSVCQWWYPGARNY